MYRRLKLRYPVELFFCLVSCTPLGSPGPWRVLDTREAIGEVIRAKITKNRNLKKAVVKALFIDLLAFGAIVSSVLVITSKNPVIAVIFFNIFICKCCRIFNFYRCRFYRFNLYYTIRRGYNCIIFICNYDD